MVSIPKTGFEQVHTVSWTKLDLKYTKQIEKKVTVSKNTDLVGSYLVVTSIEAIFQQI